MELRFVGFSGYVTQKCVLPSSIQKMNKNFPMAHLPRPAHQIPEDALAKPPVRLTYHNRQFVLTCFPLNAAPSGGLTPDDDTSHLATRSTIHFQLGCNPLPDRLIVKRLVIDKVRFDPVAIHQRYQILGIGLVKRYVGQIFHAASKSGTFGDGNERNPNQPLFFLTAYVPTSACCAGQRLTLVLFVVLMTSLAA